MASGAHFDPSTPSIARVYDYLLNGTANFAADREVAERLLAVAPLTGEVTRENRRLLRRGDPGVQPLGGGVRQLLRPPGSGAAGRGRRQGVAPGLGAGRAPPSRMVRPTSLAGPIGTELGRQFE